jgi:hypothetical protein
VTNRSTANNPKDVVNELSADITRCVKYIKRYGHQFWRRTYVRTVFSALEAINDTIRDKARHAACRDSKRFNLTRLFYLNKTHHVIADDGRFQIKDRRVSFVRYTAFVLRALAEESGESADFFAQHGWAQFKHAVKIRNRLTHPKAVEDLRLTDRDLNIVHAGVVWYFFAVTSGMSNKRVWTHQIDPAVLSELTDNGPIKIRKAPINKKK